jgi:hypothetical protein
MADSSREAGMIRFVKITSFSEVQKFFSIREAAD